MLLAFVEVGHDARDGCRHIVYDQKVGRCRKVIPTTGRPVIGWFGAQLQLNRKCAQNIKKSSKKKKNKTKSTKQPVRNAANSKCETQVIEMVVNNIRQCPTDHLEKPPPTKPAEREREEERKKKKGLTMDDELCGEKAKQRK